MAADAKLEPAFTPPENHMYPLHVRARITDGAKVRPLRHPSPASTIVKIGLPALVPN